MAVEVGSPALDHSSAQSHPYLESVEPIRPFRLMECSLGCGCGFDSTGRVIEDDHEPVASILDHGAVEFLEGHDEYPMVLSMRLPHRQLVGVPETGAAFDVSEEKCYWAFRKIISHDVVECMRAAFGLGSTHAPHT